MNEKCLTVAATMDNLDRVIGFVEEQLNEEACPVKIQGQIIVSLEELYVNVVNYAYDGAVGECSLYMSILPCDNERKMVLTIKDRGKPFNPLLRQDPDITLSADERQIGGLGIYMVKKSMDQVTYEYDSGYNALTICKAWQI